MPNRIIAGAPATSKPEHREAASSRCKVPSSKLSSVAEAARAKAMELHDEVIELLAEASKMDPDFGHATYIMEQGLSIIVNADVTDNVKWNHEANKVDSLIRGALTVGDATPGQAVILQRSMAAVAALLLLTGGSFEAAEEALEAIANGSVEVPPVGAVTRATVENVALDLSPEAAELGIDVSCGIAAIATLLAEQLQEARTGSMNPSRFGPLCVLADRAEALACVALTIFNGEELTAEQIVMAKGGAA